MQGPFTRRNFLGLASAAAGGLGVGLGRLAAANNDSTAQARADEADRLIAIHVNSGELAAAAFLMRQGAFEFARGYGHAKVDTPFLIASPTKPMTVSAVMWLRERRQLELSDPVGKYLAHFKGDGREAVTIKHLLTHTSGLPDMLPENVELRRRHAPLSEFIAQTCRTPLLFSPGAQVSYQSMGILLAAAIVEKISGQALPAFLAANVFSPLRMARTSLGLGGRVIADTAQCQVPENERSDWDWNSAYWRNLGAPWGGAHSTVRDLATFLAAFTGTGSVPWEQSTRREMVEVQTGAGRPRYGLGWMREPGTFGKSCSPAAFGHHGSTGTVAWHDPESDVTCVVLTTRPAVDSRAGVLLPVSEIAGRSDRSRVR
ncbi:MAG TPA: serine hydrolase domain-containing protein [Opitutaceae bacterium]|nr:serine hydrolase domain-containing protein [Opitutaceae bacterium]